MKCNLCEIGDLKLIFSLGKQPLANKYPKNQNEIENEKLFEMNIFFCEKCLCCNLPINIDRKIFFSDYYYLSSVNRELVEHFNQLAKELVNKKFVIDIGSNDGILIKPLKQLNVNCIGVEPSENVGKIANDLGFKTIISFFDDKCSDIIISDYGKSDCIIASSVFTHLESPKKFIINAKRTLSEDGVLIIEVEYLFNILEKMQFERFYFDRPFYYTLTSLKSIFSSYGMEITDVKLIKPHGGSIRVYIKKKSKNIEVNKNVEVMLKKERDLISENFIKIKFKNFKNEINNLLKNLKKFKEQNIIIKGYGAPARLATITNFANIDKNLIKYVIDDSELKANRYSPGKHIPIEPYNPDDDLSHIILFAYEYFQSIKNKIEQKNVEYYKPVPFEKLN